MESLPMTLKMDRHLHQSWSIQPSYPDILAALATPPMTAHLGKIHLAGLSAIHPHPLMYVNRKPYYDCAS